MTNRLGYTFAREKDSMDRHDPYGVLLLELLDSNDCREEDLEEELTKTQTYVKQIREAYSKSPSSVDYGDMYFRAAYLLAYYPKYTEVLYYVLQRVSRTLSKLFEKDRVRACFLGAGPAPEVIGWIRYLNAFASTPVHAHAYLLDREICGWQKGQEITRYHLAPIYWPNGKLITSAHQFDFVADDLEQQFENHMVQQAFLFSELFVMQNCINDQLRKRQRFLDNLVSIFWRMKPGSVFVIIDLPHEQVWKFMKDFERRVQMENIGEVICPAPKSVTARECSFAIPPLVQTILFDEDADRLRPPKQVRYRYSVIKRIADEVDDLPF